MLTVQDRGVREIEPDRLPVMRQTIDATVAKTDNAEATPSKKGLAMRWVATGNGLVATWSPDDRS